jgi:hypothetical protein
MSVIIIIKHVEWIKFIPGSWNNMTQRQEIQLGQVPRSIMMAGEDQVGEHGDDEPVTSVNGWITAVQRVDVVTILYFI